MGSGSWDAKTYSVNSSLRASAGKSDFDYSDTTIRKPSSTWAVHESLDPKSTNKDGDHAGLNVREALDSDEHPNSVPIAVLFDVTGSMGTVPRQLQKKLPELFGLLLRKGYVEDPQIMFGAIGDATCDRVPLQMGQFESDNRLDEDLGNVFLEGGGGGQTTESYELALHFMAHNTYVDCFEKRGKKGYLFIIGDEKPYATVKPREVLDVIGATIQDGVTVEDALHEVQEKWEVYVIRPDAGSYHAGEHSGDDIIETWRAMLGQNVLPLDDTNAVCETIALTIGLGEGAIDDLDEGVEHLKELGLDHESASKALATISASGGAVAVSDTPSDLDE